MKIPKTMLGKDYNVSIQAINKNKKMSMVSEKAVFYVDNKTKDTPAANKIVQKDTVDTDT